MPQLHSIRFRLSAANGMLAGLLLGISLLATVQFSDMARTVSLVSGKAETLLRISHTLDNREALQQALKKGWAPKPDAAAQARFMAMAQDMGKHLYAGVSRSEHDQQVALTAANKNLADLVRTLTATKGAGLDELAALQSEEALDDLLGLLAKVKLDSAMDVETRLRTVRESVGEPVRLFWMVASVGLGLSIIVIVFVRMRVAVPIKKLVESVRAFAAGQKVHVGDLGQDEIGELGRSFNNMSDTITDRTARLKLVLDSTGDALVPCNLDGSLAGSCSQRAIQWFGTPKEGQSVWDYLGERSPGSSDALRVAFQQLASDVLPFEVAADSMPPDLRVDNIIYSLSCRQITDGDRLTGILMVLQDVTSQRAAELQEAESHEVFEVVGLCFRDPDVYNGFISDADTRMQAIETGEVERQKFDLHTLKGNASMIGFVRIAAVCHELETEIDDTGERLPAERLKELTQVYWESRRRVEELVGPGQETVQLTRDEYEWLRAVVKSESLLAARVDSWRLTRLGRILDQLATHTRRIAERLEKRVDVIVSCGDIRIDRKRFEGVWSALVHAARNAVDHGIEPSEDRQAIGKRASGTIRITADTHGGFVRVIIEDDGRGIDVDLLRERVRELHGDVRASMSLLDLVCTSGASTAGSVTEFSGRGVGMGALSEAVRAHGGVISISTDLGKGTRVEIELPADTGIWWEGRRAA